LWGKGGWGHKESKEPFSGFRSREPKNKGKKGGVIGYGLAVCCVGKTLLRKKKLLK